jgi:membrane protease YdiL (CAAX protease family)
MDSRPSVFARRPLLLSVLVVTALVGVGLVLHVVFGGVPPGPGRFLLTGAVLVPSLAIALFIASRLGFHRSGFRRDLDPTGRWSLLLLALPVLAAALVLPLRASLGAGPFLLTGALALLVALHEETWFRGVILTALATRGPTYAVVASAMLFGIAHSFNLLTTGAPAAAVAYQVATAALVGIVFGAVRLRTAMIWPSVVGHAAVDWAALLVLYPSTAPQTPRTLTVVLGLLIYGTLAVIGLVLVWRAESRLRADLRLG